MHRTDHQPGSPGNGLTPTTAPAGHAPAEAGMTHPQILRALSGLLLGMFVAILSSTVVSTALPIIVSDLGGSQSSFTWVVTSTLLALTVSTPIWGKLADMYPRKTLVQTGLVIYTLGSILAAFSQSIEQLIAFRVIQGLGIGGLTALVQVILADLVSPRERGRYAGYLGAVFGVGTVAGPLIGGVVTDAIGWRWCFGVGIPFSIAAFITLQRTLHLPRHPRGQVSLDWLGAITIAGAVSSLLIWVTMAGHQFDWISWQTALLVPLGVLLAASTVLVERRAKDALIPLRLFKDRIVVLSVIASVSVGIALFGTTVFLSQYLQLARGMSPTESGLLSIPMVTGLFLASTIIGRRVSATGRYKRFMQIGAALLTLGLAMMGTLDEHTSLIELGVFMFIVGAGVGMLMQNLVLVVQNTIERSDMGAGSSLIAFFRSMGGAIGVSVLGAVLAARVTSSITDSMTAAGLPAAQGGSASVPKLSELSPQMVEIVEHAYGTGIAEVFLVAVPLAFLALIAVSLMPEKPLQTTSGLDDAVAERSGSEPGPADGHERSEPTAARQLSAARSS